MTQLLNRSLQHKILSGLADLYPSGTDDVQPLVAGEEVSEKELIANVMYLSEHNLLISGYRAIRTIGHSSFQHVGETVITAAGLDFLQDDGGLSAILGVVTVKFDAQQWADLLATKIENSSGISHDERSALAKAVRNLPAKAIEKLSSKMLDWAVDHLPDALPQLHMWLAQVAG